MGIFGIFLREGRSDIGNVVLSLLAVAVAVGAWAGTAVLLRGHDARTAVVLETKRQDLEVRLAEMQDEMRKATLKLSFNLLILPEGQDLRTWYTDGVIEGTMPEDYVNRLATCGIVTVRHFLPIVQRRLWWEERDRRIILVGSKGEVSNLHMNPRKPLVQPVPTGSIVLGYELHRSLGLEPGNTVALLGRQFTVHRCHEQRGSQDDITAWIHLAEAQELFDMSGRLHAILALECLCAGMPGADKFRAEIGKVLPGTEVVEFGTKALARAEARFGLGHEVKDELAREEQARKDLRHVRERFADVLLPVVMLLCVAALAALAVVNVRRRTAEFALLRALGVGGGSLLWLVLLKYAVAAIPGALAGCVAGMAAGAWAAGWLDPVVLPDGAPLLSSAEAGAAVAVAVAVSLGAAWLPALLAACRDPATVLNRE